MYICFCSIFPFLFLSLHCKQNTEPTSLFLFSYSLNHIYFLTEKEVALQYTAGDFFYLI